MSEILAGLTSWQALVIGLLVFGLAPGILLRAIVLLYRSDDPARREVLAELRAVPRWERPFWVAEQLEAALFEGFVARVRIAIAYKRGFRSGQREVQRTLLDHLDGRRIMVLKDNSIVHVPSFARLQSTSMWRSWPRVTVGYVRLSWNQILASPKRAAKRTSLLGAGGSESDLRSNV